MTPDTPADGALAEAIAEAVAYVRQAEPVDEPWRASTFGYGPLSNAIATILNAVLSGALIPRPAANGWRPIETAPRDGTWFRARTEHGTERVVHFADEADRYPISHDGEVWSTAPVEWTPVAPRPAEPKVTCPYPGSYERGDCCGGFCNMEDDRPAEPAQAAQVGEPDSLIERLRGRALFLRHRGEIKTPGLLEQAAARIAAAQEGRE